MLHFEGILSTYESCITSKCLKPRKIRLEENAAKEIVSYKNLIDDIKISNALDPSDVYPNRNSVTFAPGEIQSFQNKLYTYTFRHGISKNSHIKNTVKKNVKKTLKTV